MHLILKYELIFLPMYFSGKSSSKEFPTDKKLQNFHYSGSDHFCLLLLKK